AWKRLCKEAGVKAGKLDGYVIHDTRRTTARTKRAAGVAETVAAATLGWKPGSKMFARYGIVDTADTLIAQQAQEKWEADQRAKADQSQLSHNLASERDRSKQSEGQGISIQ